MKPPVVGGSAVFSSKEYNEIYLWAWRISDDHKEIGFGLGLDTAHRIVSKHSGFLTVESKLGATCFQVRIPLDQAQAY